MAESNRKRILLVTHEIPYPADRDGWSIITYPILTRLKADYDIDLVFPVFEKHQPEEEHLNILRDWCDNVVTFPVSRNFYKRALTALFHPLPLVYTLYRFEQIQQATSSLIEKYNSNYKAVIIADPHCARFIKKFELPQEVNKIFIASDYTTLMYQRICSKEKKILSKMYHWLTYQKLRVFEPIIYGDYNRVVYVSSADKQELVKRHESLGDKIGVIPNGIDFQKFRSDGDMDSSGVSILFVGNMNFKPNLQAVNWFYGNVFKRLKSKYEKITFFIVGRDADKHLAIDDSNVIIKSSVPSVLPYLHKATIVISPLISGTGLKNKVVEAMACSKLVVGSRLSFDSIPVFQGKHAVIVETADDYLRELSKYIEAEDERKAIEKNAFKLVQENFDVDLTVSKWKKLIEEKT